MPPPHPGEPAPVGGDHHLGGPAPAIPGTRRALRFVYCWSPRPATCGTFSAQAEPIYCHPGGPRLPPLEPNRLALGRADRVDWQPTREGASAGRSNPAGEPPAVQSEVFVEFIDIVRKRYAVRQYKDEKVPEETIRQLLDIIRYSPSAINLQPWKIKVVSDQATKDALFPATFNQQQVRSCSHLLVLCADTDYPALIDRYDKALAASGAPAEMRSFVVNMASDLSARMTPQEQLQWSREQVHIALGNALNGAYALGLGACPMTAFDPAEYSRILALPPTVVPTVLVSVGYATDEPPAAKLRYPLEEILI